MIAGKSKDHELTEFIQAKADSNPAIQFIPGFIEDDDVQMYMNAADVVTFPYKNILTSGAVMLAISFGRACLAPQKDCIGLFGQFWPEDPPGDLAHTAGIP